jgi:energy-coupling factor transport system ATP-binding protein
MKPVITTDIITLDSGYTVPKISISPSENLAIVGRSGSGKTQFCKMLLKHPEYLHNDLQGENFFQYVGYIPTDPRLLFSGMKSTLVGEIELSLQFLGKNLDNIEEIASLFEVEDLLYRDPFTLSGGESVRAALAMVGIKKPKLWILDQIFDWLHPDSRIFIRDLINLNKVSDSIVIEAHSCAPDWIDDFDNCIFFDLSKTVKLGKFSELRPVIEDSFLIDPGYKHINEINPTEHVFISNFSKEDEVVFNSLNAKFDKPNTDIGEKLVQITGLSFQFPKASFSLGPVNLEVQPGIVLALLGENGAGKTTFLKCLALLLKPVSGLVKINGNQASDIPHLRPREFFYCFQDPDKQLFLPTVGEELLSTIRHLRGKHIRALNENQIAILTDFELSENLKISALTRAQRRMVTLASGFISHSTVLLLDEPTSGLDGYQKNILAKALLNFSYGGGIALIVSHDYNFVDCVANKTIWIKDGQLL